MKIRTLSVNFLLAAATTLFCLTSLEIALRLIYPKPSQDRVTSLEYRHRWVFNSDGFRDDEFKEKLKKNKENILLLGDSFTAGLGVEREDSFANLLAQKLNDRYETFNLGKPATGTFNQFEILNQWIDPIHPTHVILFFFWNDVADNFIMPKDSPYQPLQTAEVSKQRPFFSFLKPLKPWLRKTVLYEWVSQRYRILLTRLGLSKLDYGMEFDLFEKNSPSPAVKLAWKNTRKSLWDMKALCVTRNPLNYGWCICPKESKSIIGTTWSNFIKRIPIGTIDL